AFSSAGSSAATTIVHGVASGESFSQAAHQGLSALGAGLSDPTMIGMSLLTGFVAGGQARFLDDAFASGIADGTMANPALKRFAVDMALQTGSAEIGGGGGLFVAELAQGKSPEDAARLAVQYMINNLAMNIAQNFGGALGEGETRRGLFGDVSHYFRKG